MPHDKRPARDCCGRHDLEITLFSEVADFDLAQTHDRQRRCLDPPDPDHPFGATREQCLGRRPRQRQIENLIGLLACNGRIIKRLHLTVRLELVEGLPQRLRILRREQRTPHLPAIAQMLQDFLPDQLPFAITIGRQDHFIATLQRGSNRREFGHPAAASSDFSRIEAVRLQKLTRPALPLRLHLMRLSQTQQMPLGGENFTESIAKRRPQIARLTGFFRDDKRRHGAIS